MPTTSGRRDFIRQSIRYFQRQDYSNRELLIVTDGPDTIGDLLPSNDPQIRHVHLSGQRTLGAKRNACVDQARGDLIMHWDDDDWFAPNRITYQTEYLLKNSAEVCGLRRMLFYDPAQNKLWLYSYPEGERSWLAGGSLVYTRDFWKRAPFPNVQVASDTTFIWTQDLHRAVTLADERFYVAIIHSQNTSPKNCDGSYWSPSDANVRELLTGDFDFYQGLFSRTKNRGVAPQRTTSVPVQPETTAPAIGSPKVSCILATGNRAGFTRQAIRCFLRQTMDDSELIVVDDGDQSVAELCAGLFRVRHIRLREPTTLGRKLNIGIEHARGSIIQKLDDDDFYAPEFLARSVAALENAGNERAIVTWDCFNVLVAGERMLHNSGHGWTTGGTLCFYRTLWNRHAFRDVPERVDTFFIEDNSPALVRVCAPELYTLVRHGRNTWTRLSSGATVDDHFRYLPVQRRLDEMIEPLDVAFYESLGNGRQV
jgi:glycosyltransferase involved in cell wall biosynthesis